MSRNSLLLPSPKQIASSESTAKVQGLVQKTVNAENLNRLGSEISHFTASLVDAIAPPLFAAVGADEYRFTDAKIFADTLTVWSCCEAVNGENLDVLHDFLQQTVNELWLSEVPLQASDK
ncbi:hypothetical protein HK096_008185, partial [Nowakowskiella sp. JEL0078]